MHLVADALAPSLPERTSPSHSGPSHSGPSLGGPSRIGQIAIGVLAALLIGLPMMLLEPPYALLAPVVLAILPVAGLIAFNNAFALCLVFIVFSFFRIHEAFPILNPLRIPSLVAIPTLLVLGWHIALSRSIKPFWSKELKAFSVFFVLTTIGVLFAVNRASASAYWMSTYWKIAIMVVAIAWLTREPKDFLLAARALVIGGSAVAIVAITNKLGGIGLVEGTRVTIARDMGSVLGDPNDLSLVLLFPLGFAACLVAYPTGWLNKIIGSVGTALIIWAIICTQSRGGFLGIIATFGVVGFRVVKSKGLFIAIGCVMAVALFVGMGISKRASGGAAEQGIDESSMGRIYAWQAAWKMAAKNPLNGVGLDNFTGNYYFYSPHWDGMNHAVHSTWFNVLAETGFPGFIAFVTMIIICIRSSYKSMVSLNTARAPPIVRAMSLSLVAGLISFCVAGTFLTQGFTWPIYILLALTTAMAKYARDYTPEPHSTSITAVT
jgi:putative inorganic carbon (hco3(-)) transporter